MVDAHKLLVQNVSLTLHTIPTQSAVCTWALGWFAQSKGALADTSGSKQISVRLQSTLFWRSFCISDAKIVMQQMCGEMWPLTRKLFQMLCIVLHPRDTCRAALLRKPVSFCSERADRSGRGGSQHGWDERESASVWRMWRRSVRSPRHPRSTVREFQPMDLSPSEDRPQQANTAGQEVPLSHGTWLSAQWGHSQPGCTRRSKGSGHLTHLSEGFQTQTFWQLTWPADLDHLHSVALTLLTT